MIELPRIMWADITPEHYPEPRVSDGVVCPECSGAQGGQCDSCGGEWLCDQCGGTGRVGVIKDKQLWYFGGKYDEELTCRDPREYVVDMLDQWGDASLPEQLEVTAYRSKEIDDEWIKYEAACLVERWNERFGEEYGPCDDAPDAGSDVGEMLALLQGFTKRAFVYQCDDHSVIVFTYEDLYAIALEEWPGADNPWIGEAS